MNEEMRIMNIRHSWNEYLNEITGLYHNVSMKLNISDSECMIMYMLYDEPKPITQSDIVRTTGLSKQTVNSAIRKLEKGGIITLEKLNEKSKILVVTEIGKKVIAEKIMPIIEMENRVFDSWTKEEASLFLELTKKYKNMFEEEVLCFGKK